MPDECVEINAGLGAGFDGTNKAVEAAEAIKLVAFLQTTLAAQLCPIESRAKEVD